MQPKNSLLYSAQSMDSAESERVVRDQIVLSPGWLQSPSPPSPRLTPKENPRPSLYVNCHGNSFSHFVVVSIPLFVTYSISVYFPFLPIQSQFISVRWLSPLSLQWKHQNSYVAFILSCEFNVESLQKGTDISVDKHTSIQIKRWA